MEKILEVKEVNNRNGKDIKEIEDTYGIYGGFDIITNRQTVSLLMDDYQNCCENYGYFWCNEDPKDFIGAELINISITDTELNKSLYQSNGAPDTKGEYFEGGVMFVDIETNKGTLQFVAYNEHNGYYGHDAIVTCSQLNHREVL